MNIKYPPKLAIGQMSTPLVPLDNLSKQLGGPRIWMKRDDMTGFASGGNKVRKLEYLLADAKAGGYDTLVTQGAYQSNHCRATALLGAKTGFQTSLLLLGDLSQNFISGDEVPDSNLLISRLSGAEITYYDAAEYGAHLEDILDEKIAALEKSGRKPYKIPAGATTPLGLWAYIECAQELKADFERLQISPKYIVHATGTTGTQAGLTLGNQLYNLGAEIWGVAVLQNAAYFEELTQKNMRLWKEEFGMNIDVESLPVNTFDEYIGHGYSEPDAETFETVRMVAALEGFLLDPVYSGRGLHGLIGAIRKGHFSDAEDVVFIHTGGALGIFAQRNKFKLDDSLTSIYGT
jgi:D-cysteine desulfhydrase